MNIPYPTEASVQAEMNSILGCVTIKKAPNAMPCSSALMRELAEQADREEKSPVFTDADALLSHLKNGGEA